jgi:tRNA(Ile2)-agmatinylcytidine synthase
MSMRESMHDLNSKLVVTLSFDDIDYLEGGCTTHFTGLFLINLLKRNYRLADYPGLVRLNPAIPWKTRGNAATFIRVYVNDEVEGEDLFELAINLVSEYCSERREKDKGPGIVLTFGEIWKDPRMRLLYKRALNDVLVHDVVIKVLGKVGSRFWGGRGVIGAAAAQASLAPGDPYTFELLAYRKPELWGQERCIEKEKIWKVEASLPTCVYNNYDIINDKLSAAPGGPDPILAGFRGTCPEFLKCYSAALCEDPSFWVLYKSNQHTDVYARYVTKIRYYRSGTILGEVIKKPVNIPGGHVLVKIRVKSSNEIIDVVFFRETGPLRDFARLLDVGDLVEVIGSFRPYSIATSPVLAVDKIRLLSPSIKYQKLNPRCPKCGYRMKSDGKNFRCPKCGYRLSRDNLIYIFMKRAVVPLELTPQEGRLRHLTASPIHELPKVLTLPISLNINEVVAVGSNPPVIDPSISCGTH